MTAHRWVPPSSGVAHTDLPLWNAAMSYMDVPLPLDQSGGRLRLSPIGAPVLTGPLHVFQTATDETLFVHLDAFPFQDMLNVDLDLAALNDLPAPLADAIHAGSAEILLNAVPKTLTIDVKPIEMVPSDQAQDVTQTEGVTWFAAAIDTPPKGTIFFSIGITPSDACNLLRDRTLHPRSVLSGLKQILDVPIRRTIGHATLGLEAANNVTPGDLIVLERATSDALTITAENHAYTFEQDEDGWRCDAIHPRDSLRKFTAMADHPTTPPTDPKGDQDQATPPQQPPSVAPVATTVLTFDCGETRVTLADLESYQVGAIVALPDDLTKDGLRITIRAGETPIATGDVVQVDDRMAVRINRLLTTTA